MPVGSPSGASGCCPIAITRVGRVTLRLPEPSQSEGDGLAADLTHAQSLTGGDPAWVTIRPGRSAPTPSTSHRVRATPEYRMPESRSASGKDLTIGLDVVV